MMSTPTAIPPTIVQLTGPLLLGHLFNWGLFGTLSVQAYIYYLSFPKDRHITKVIVLCTWVIEVLQIVMSTRDAFRDYGTGWGNLVALDAVGWMGVSILCMTSIIGGTAQTFYAWRIWLLSGKRRLLPSMIVTLAIAQSAANLYNGVMTQKLGRFSQVQENLYGTTAVWLTGTGICDALITTGMMHYLYRSKTGIRSTNLMLTKLIRITVETGMICVVFTIIDLALVISFKYNNYHLPLCMALSKLYSNSLFAVLNSRVRIVGGRNIDSSVVELDSEPSFTVEMGNASAEKRMLARGHLPRSDVMRETMTSDIDSKMQATQIHK